MPGDRDDKSESPFRRYRGMLLATVAVPLFGGLLLSLHGLGVANGLAVTAFGLLVAMAALIVGGLAGFLFGIPRALQGTGDAVPREGGYAVNTNLEQISDWLTKILVGVGLVQLGQVPHAISRLSNAIAPGLGGNPVAAGVILVLFSTWGFFLGYLITRTYLTAALRDFDDLGPEKVVSTMNDAVDSFSSVGADPAIGTRELRPPLDSPVPPTHNREPLEEPLPVPWFDSSNLVSVRAAAVAMLSQLVLPARADRFASPDEIVDVLTRRGVLVPSQARALEQLFGLAEQMSSGARLQPGVVQAAKWRGTALLEKLSQLGSTSAARFEEHVLSTVEREVSRRWTVQQDVKIVSGRVEKYDDVAGPEARVDAVLTDRRTGRSVAVEVRARIRDQQQVTDLAGWLSLMPTGIPILVIVPNVSDAVASFLDDVVRNGANRAALVVWDTEADTVPGIIDRF